MAILLPLEFDLSELNAAQRFSSVSTAPAATPRPTREPKLGELSSDVLVVQPAIDPIESDLTN